MMKWGSRVLNDSHITNDQKVIFFLMGGRGFFNYSKLLVLIYQMTTNPIILHSTYFKHLSKTKIDHSCQLRTLFAPEVGVGILSWYIVPWKHSHANFDSRLFPSVSECLDHWGIFSNAQYAQGASMFATSCKDSLLGWHDKLIEHQVACSLLQQNLIVQD